MLLPASFGASRRMNDSHDIRRNLRFRNPELQRPTADQLAAAEYKFAYNSHLIIQFIF